MKYLRGTESDEKLKKAEFRYRLLLRNCDLIGQLAISLHELEEICMLLDEATPSIEDERRHFTWFCKDYASVISVFLTFSAVYKYVSHTANFWDGVWAQLQMKRTYARQELMGLTFREFIRDAGLIEFHSATHAFVDPILLHATIPAQCLDNFFAQVLMPLALEPDSSLADVGGLLKPVESFLSKGGRVAEDFVNRSLRLYQVLEKNDGLDTTDAAEVASQFGLAAHVVEALVKWFPIRHTVESTGPGGRRGQPRLVLDPYELGLAIELPPALVQGFYETTASITYGGRLHKHDICPGSMGSDSCRIPLYGPSREYAIALGNGYSASIRGLEIDRPYYFNAKTGRRLPFGLLPAGVISVISPSSVTPIGDGNADSPILERLPPLLGNWGPHRVLHLDTRGHRYLHWVSDNDQIVSDWDQAIDDHEETRPVLVGGCEWTPELVGFGTPLIYLGDAPILQIPLDRDKLERYWIRVERKYDRTPFYDGVLTGLGKALSHCINGVQIDLGSPRLLGGSYGHMQLFLQGPLGSDTSVEFVLLPEGFIEVLPSAGQGEVPSFFVVFDSRGGSAKAFVQSGEHGWRHVEGVFSPPDDVAEIAVRCVEKGTILAEFPIRVRGVEWRIMQEDRPDTGGWTWQSGLLSLSNDRSTASSYLLARSYFANGATHALALYANGKEIQRLPSVSSGALPQRSRFLIDSFLDAMQAHAAEELAMVLMVHANGVKQAIPVAEMMFSWHVSNLRLAVTEGPLYSVAASWREYGQPATERQLVLYDNWRNRAIRLPISGDATRIQTSFLPEELPPARYSIGFSTKRTWTGKERHPVSVSPSFSIDVAPHSWRRVLTDTETPAKWLTAARALMCGCEVGLPTPARPGFWQKSELEELARVLVLNRRNSTFYQVTRALMGWTKEELLEILQAAPQYSCTWLRGIALALSLPRMVSIAHPTSLDQIILQAWPVLSYLTGSTPLPTLDGTRLEYTWGIGYKVRDPLSYEVVHPSEELHADWPSTILAIWLRKEGMRVLADENMHSITELRDVLKEQIGKLYTVVNRLDFLGKQGFRYGVRAIRRSLEQPDVLYSRTGTIAYVAACVALIQRFAARDSGIHGYFTKHPALESWCDYCPELYDYYLLLSETVYRLRA